MNNIIDITRFLDKKHSTVEQENLKNKLNRISDSLSKINNLIKDIKQMSSNTN